jgi:acyl-CoA thioester hydrolase
MRDGHSPDTGLRATRAPDLTGAVRVRVRYAECDPMGVAYHGNYLPWMEIGRTELLRTSGVSYGAMEAEGFFLVITRCAVRYRRPVRYDDLIEIRTRVEQVSRVKIRHAYEVVLIERHSRSADPADPATPPDGVCATGDTELACVGADGRPRELPAWLTR